MYDIVGTYEHVRYVNMLDMYDIVIYRNIAKRYLKKKTDGFFIDLVTVLPYDTAKFFLPAGTSIKEVRLVRYQTALVLHLSLVVQDSTTG